jgi:hypothetical protein
MKLKTFSYCALFVANNKTSRSALREVTGLPQLSNLLFLRLSGLKLAERLRQAVAPVQDLAV